MSNSIRIFLRFIRYLLPYRIQVICLVLSTVIAAIASLGVPFSLKILIDKVIISQKPFLIVWILATVITIILFQNILNYINSYMFGRLSQMVIFDIRLELFKHLHEIDIDFFNKARTGDIVSRFLSDVNDLYFLISDSLVGSVSNILMLIVAVCALFTMNVKLAVIALITLPSYGIVFSKFNRKIRSVGMENKQYLADISTILHEAISGIRTTKSFCCENYVCNVFKNKLQDYLLKSLSLIANCSLARAIINIISGISPIALFAFGTIDVLNGSMTIGSLIAFYTIIGYLYAPIQGLSGMNLNFQATAASLKRIFDILDIKPVIIEGPLPKIPGKVASGKIEFKEVCFKYGQKFVLKNLSFTINPGEKVAFVGPTGAGKTTLFNIILRFYDPSSGVILIDNVDIRNLSFKDLRTQIGVVAQDIFLFNDTVRHNIRFGCVEASEQQIRYAAKLANIHEFILSLPNGYDTIIGERGIQLSGGERQRIAIARAVVKNPQILLFDEATSSLDNESEYLIQLAMERLMKNKTTLIIAHRLSTIRNVDRIFVINEGQIVEQGKHDDLMQRKGLYWQLYTQERKEAKVG